MSKPAPES